MVFKERVFSTRVSSADVVFVNSGAQLVAPCVVVPIGPPPPDRRQSLKFNAFGNACLVGDIDIIFPMFLGLYLDLFGARETRASLIFEPHDGPGSSAANYDRMEIKPAD